MRIKIYESFGMVEIEIELDEGDLDKLSANGKIEGRAEPFEEGVPGDKVLIKLSDLNEEMMECPFCGFSIYLSTKICPKCAKKMRK